MKIKEALLAIQNSDCFIRKSAELELQELEEKNLDNFLIDLSLILKEENYECHVRKLAGLLLKNKVSSKEKNIYSCKWLASISPISRFNIKKTVINTFQSSVDVIRKTAAEIMAKIMSIELLYQKQNYTLVYFIKILENKNIQPNFHSSIIETLEFFCQEITLSRNVNFMFKMYLFQIVKILFAFINKNGKNSKNIKISALNSFLSLVYYIEEIFEKKAHRNFIIGSIYNQAKNQNSIIKLTCLEILEKISKKYYIHIKEYGTSLYILIAYTIQCDRYLSVSYATELWNTIMEEEFETILAKYKSLKQGTWFLFHSNYNIYTNFHIPFLLLDCIRKNNDDEHTEKWNCCNAAGNCLNTISQVFPREATFFSMFFVDKHMYCNVFRDIQTASLFFIAIFEGIGCKFLYSYTRKILLSWIYHLKNRFSDINDIFVLIVGKISYNISYILRHYLDQVIEIIVISIINNSHDNMCFILNEILQSLNREGLLAWYSESIFLVILKEFLFRIINNKNSNQLSEAFLRLIINSDIRDTCFILGILPYFMLYFSKNFIKNTIKFTKMKNEKEAQNYISKIINCIVQKYNNKINTILLENLFNMFFGVIVDSKITSNFSVEEEILICVNTMIQFDEIKKDLSKIKKWIFFLLNLIKNTDENDTVILLIGLLGDTCRILRKETSNFIERIIDILSEKLKKEKFRKSIALQTLSCFGDITITHKISLKCIDNLIDCLEDIANFSRVTLNFSTREEQDTDLHFKIQDSVLMSLTGIIQQIQDYDKILYESKFLKKLKWVLDYIYFSVQGDKMIALVKICIGLLGDFCLSFTCIKSIFQKECWIFQFLNESKYNQQLKIKNLGAWAFECIYGL
ncbi:importin beta-1 SU (nucleomorph) [Cryptomonas paramecium]|uniref:Importin beta-1 SU n=1 Tax=Cryptomonas paramaecium TaxID=2898 RepID=F2HI12_9CRYP|nr:importin beta-1 SU [Cryptomonas paramecium]AEA38958.1 importin beta-1 SU [Cryptomonas paramecium]